MEVGRALVERVEHNAADLGRSTAAAVAALEPASGAVAVALRDGALVFTGVGMYLNRGIGLGVAQPLDASDLDELEAFFAPRIVPAEVELCPWAGDSLLRLLEARGYRPRLFRDVFVHDLQDLAPPSKSAVTIEDATADDWPVVHTVRSDGFRITDPADRDVSARFSAAAASIPGSIEVLARIDGEPVGAAALQVCDGVASLGGMSTLPSARRRGVHTALLQHRLQRARALGCDLAVVTAVPPSASARNIRRHGFTLAYSQVIVTQPPSHPSAS